MTDEPCIDGTTDYQTIRDKSSNAGRQYDLTEADHEEYFGVLREDYTNIARRPSTYYVRDFSIVEEETEFGSEDARIEDLDEFRGEVRDFIERVLFVGGGLTFVETTLTIPRTNHVKIKEHTDGDVITVRLDVADDD